MRKIGFAFLLWLLLSVSFASATDYNHRSDGFISYKWGTSFLTVSQEKNLISPYTDSSKKTRYFSITDTKNIYNSKYTIPFEESSDFGIYFFYFFKSNQLVQGDIIFSNYSEFDDAVESLYEKYGDPVYEKGTEDRTWIIKDSLIFAFSPTDENPLGTIRFSSRQDIIKSHSR